MPRVSLFVISTEYCSDTLFLCAVHCSQSLHWFGFRVICTLEIQGLHTARSIAYITSNRHTIRCGLSCWILMWALKQHKLFWLAGPPAGGVRLVGFSTWSLWLASMSAGSWWGSSCRVLVVWGRCRRKSWWKFRAAISTTVTTFGIRINTSLHYPCVAWGVSETFNSDRHYPANTQHSLSIKIKQYGALIFHISV